MIKPRAKNADHQIPASKIAKFAISINAVGFAMIARAKNDADTST